jgi:transcription termination factor Rho
MSVDANALERETLERKDRDELQKIAGALGGKVTSRTRKADIIEMILEITGVTSSSGDADAGDADAEADDESAEKAGPVGRAESAGNGRGAGSSDTPKQADRPRPDRERNRDDRQGGDGGDGGDEAQDRGSDDRAQGGAADPGDDEAGGRRRRRRGRNRDTGGNQDEYTGEPIPVVGCLDLRDDGYGFLRVDGLLPSKDDCYVSVKQVRQFGLRKGDVVAGGSRPAFRNEKNPAMLRIDTVNDVELEPGAERPLFEDLTAVFATERVDLVVTDGDVEGDDRATRALDLLAPIGKGSRVLLAAPPRAGKTTLLQTIVRAVEANEPDLRLVVVLLDERPEEISEMQRLVAAGAVHGSAFDAGPDEHVAVLELALARARRMAEAGDDVMVLVDGLTRLARAEHASGQGSGRSVGGIDTAAIQAAKRAFGAGRNLEEAGSITIVATASVDTGSEVDEAVHDAVAGAATTQIRLDRFAAERRSFPALDVGRTSTRREELLVGDDGAARREALRRELAGLPSADSADHADALDDLLGRIRDTKSNEDLLAAVAADG